MIIFSFTEHSEASRKSCDGYESNWSHFEIESQLIGLADKVMKISSNQMDIFNESKEAFSSISGSLKPL